MTFQHSFRIDNKQINSESPRIPEESRIVNQSESDCEENSSQNHSDLKYIANSAIDQSESDCKKIQIQNYKLSMKTTPLLLFLGNAIKAFPKI